MTSAVHSEDLFSGFPLQSLNQTGELLLRCKMKFVYVITSNVLVCDHI